MAGGGCAAGAPVNAGTLVAASGIRAVTISAALGCSAVMTCRWAAGAAAPSRKAGTKGRRYFDLLRGLAAAQQNQAAARAELRLMDEEGHGERWEKYDRAWTWAWRMTRGS